MSENLQLIIQKFESLLQQHRFGDVNAFRSLNFSPEEAMDAAHLIQSHSIGISTDAKGEPILCVHVQDKQYRNSSLIKWLRKEADGRLKVIHTGKISALCGGSPLIQQTRPLQIGYSVSNESFNDAGTIGFFAQENDSAFSGIVSCNHVLANQQDPTGTRRIRQPGVFDQGSPTDDIAQPWRWVVIGASGNVSDAAYARLDAGVQMTTTLPAGVPPITGATISPAVDTNVAKLGRTTLVTRGRIDSISHNNLAIFYPQFGTISFNDIFSVVSTEACSFSHAGDSGSLILSEAGEAIGLLIATANGDINDPTRVCYGCRIDPVLSKLNIRIIPTTN